MPKQRKPAAVSITIELYDRSKERSKTLGFSSWSGYVVQLIRNDLAQGGGLAVREELPKQTIESVPNL